MNEQNFYNNAYRIETDRLVVRCYHPSDAQTLADSVAENVEHPGYIVSLNHLK